jgi:hypothetical protein
LKVLAQVCPGTSGVVNLLVLVGEAGVVHKVRCRECEDGRVLDVVVGGAVVFDFVVWVLQCPEVFGGLVCGDIRGIFGGRGEWTR